MVPSEFLVYSLLRAGHIAFCCWLPMVLFSPRRNGGNGSNNVMDMTTMNVDFMGTHGLSLVQIAAFIITEIAAAMIVTCGLHARTGLFILTDQ